MSKNFYITTPVYYTNAKPHIGHAYSTIAGDVVIRFQRLQGKNAFLLVGTDEHGLKIEKEAEKFGKSPREFVDEIVNEFKDLWKRLNIQYDVFTRTTDVIHKKVVQKVLQTLYDKGVIYKGEYEGLYCIGCEQFKSDNELVDGKCPDHDKEPELLKEECYLLKMSEMQKTLIEKIKSDELKISPEQYKKEMLSFLETQKLKDISISRKNVKWGIPLPFDAEHTVYVWFDAFLSYITGLGWDGDIKKMPSLWPAEFHLIGKDILRVHATIWPVILMHLEVELPKMIFTHGHILSGGKKMSKSLGNVISINEMIEKFGTDGTRYLLLSSGTFGSDTDITIERLVEKYNADLANGLGNLLSRVIKLAQNFQFPISNFQSISNDSMSKFIEKMELSQALEYIWNIIREDNKYIEENKPWELVKNDENKFEEVMEKLVSDLYLISQLLTSFLPETSEKMKKALETKEPVMLFQRIK